ncbi:lysozyme inhibitor LprI family protein [Mesorhizobium sp. M0802]|uniref:lysozyme inhibitor LprI family protein n=1 Tax=Mesorhizobium sp. M0802 TaxID=2957001 RepID=UPI00333B4996
MVRHPQADLETSMRLLFVSASLAVLAAASIAQAQECDRNDDSQQMMNICAGEDYRAADAKLNQAYKDLVGRNDDKGRKLLQVAQRAWIASATPNAPIRRKTARAAPSIRWRFTMPDRTDGPAHQTAHRGRQL